VTPSQRRNAMRLSENAVSDSPPAGGSAKRAAPTQWRKTDWEGEKPAWIPTPVPPALLQAARNMRQHMTDAEQRLWHCLRGKQLDGCRFRKQHPIAHFVLDFYCPTAKLAIEIDGGQHNTAPGRASDEERTRCLNARGIHVLRFWNHEVLQDLPGVLERIWEALHLPPPHLGARASAQGRQALPPAGGR
jgi:very-short-patch-repair endonuclease